MLLQQTVPQILNWIKKGGENWTLDPTLYTQEIDNLFISCIGCKDLQMGLGNHNSKHLMATWRFEVHNVSNWFWLIFTGRQFHYLKDINPVISNHKIQPLD